MSNRPKAKGTRAETAVARYLRWRLDDERIERRALHGSKDMGDIFGIRAHGHTGIAEVKYRTEQKGLLAGWRQETEIEQGNADADFALLVCHAPHCNMEDPDAPTFGQNRVHVTLRSLFAIAGVSGWTASEDALDGWVSMTLDECCDLIEGA